MIDFTFTISMPFVRDKVKPIWWKMGSLSKNKSYEIELNRDRKTLVEIHINTHITGSDHAGPRIYLCLLSYAISVNIHDKRHWNYISNKWKNYDEDINC